MDAQTLPQLFIGWNREPVRTNYDQLKKVSNLVTDGSDNPFFVATAKKALTLVRDQIKERFT